MWASTLLAEDQIVTATRTGGSSGGRHRRHANRHEQADQRQEESKQKISEP